MLPKTRKEAIEQGINFYFTGIACPNGHIDKRLTTSCACDGCRKEIRNRPAHKEKSKEYKQNAVQKEKARIYAKKYHAENREVCLHKMRIKNPLYYEANSEKIKKNTLEYQKNNTEARTKYKKEWSKNKAKNDPIYKMSLVARRMLHRALGVAGQVKYKRTKDYLPYSYEELVLHLESKFADGMTWGNYGEWHIGHIKPINFYVKIGVTDPAIINALENLQPLWAIDNMKKGNKDSNNER